MEVNFTPEVQAKLDRLAEESGCSSEEFVKDAVIGLVDNLAQVREMLDSRYDDLESGGVQLIDGEAFFAGLRRREDDLLTTSKAG